MTLGFPAHTTERSASMEPSLPVSYTFTPSTVAGTSPNSSLSNLMDEKMDGRYSSRMGSTCTRMASLVATSR
eukprot:3273140-Pyramimonas_sp.AAC.1